MTKAGLGDLLTLLIQIPLGVLLYVAGSRILKIDSFGYILDTMKKMRNRRKENA